MLRELDTVTARFELANAALDSLIFTLHERLVACRKLRAKEREFVEKERRRAPATKGLNLWWVGGDIPLDILFPGRTPHEVEEGFG